MFLFRRPPTPSAPPPEPPEAPTVSIPAPQIATPALPESVPVQEEDTASTTSSPDVTDDFFAFCKKIGAKEFQKIIKEGQLIQYEADSTVYLQGEDSDSFYVVNSGVIELVISDPDGQNAIPITYLTKGNLFGEIGLLTDMPRSASVRVPESATLLRFDRKAFQSLIASVPAFGHYLAITLAHRLHTTTMQLHFHSNARELSGSFDSFDLPTIFQTISISQQHGVMQIHNLTSEILGEFVFANGTPISAQFGHLNGIEALLQLFLVTPKANFGFTRTTEPPVIESPLEIHNVNEFTMHAVHLKDEMVVIEEKLKFSDEQPLKRIHAHLKWSYPDLQSCAKELWHVMKEPLPLKDIFTALPYCRYHLLVVIDRLFETDQLALAEITPYGYR